jgi:hypothetical protein
MMASELRKKFENYLVLSRLSAKTQEAYLKAVEGLAFFHNQSPDKLSDEQIQQYLLYALSDPGSQIAMELVQCGLFRTALLLQKISQTGQNRV